MRKTISIILLSIWLFNLLGGTGYFLAQLHYQRRAMHQLLADTPKDRLTRIELTINAFEEAIYEDDELLLDGEMFDIAFVEKTSSTIIVFGLFDRDEDDILGNIKIEASRQTEDGNAARTITQFSMLQFLVIQSPEPTVPWSFLLNEELNTQTSELPTSPSTVNYPPPEMLT